MSVATIVVMIIGGGVLAWSRRLRLGWLAPANIYAVVWAMGVALYDARLFPFYDLAPETWALLAAGGVSFLAAAMWGSSRRAGRGTPSRSSKVIEADPFPVVRTFLVVGLCGSAVFLWRVNNYTGLVNFFSEPQPTYHALTIRAIDTSYLFLYYFGIAGAIIFGYAVMLLGRRPRAIDLALLALFIVAMAIAMERTHFLWVLASWTFLRLAPVRGSRTLLEVALTVGVAMAVAAPFYLAVGKWIGKTPATYSNYIRIVAEEADAAPPPTGGRRSSRTAARLAQRPSRLSLIMPGGPFHRLSVFYIAIAAPMPTFNHIVVNPEALRYGRMTLRPIFRLAERLRLIPGAEASSIYPDVPTPYPANAYTFLYEFYLDFGWIGVLMLPAVFGWVSGVSYARTSETVGISAWPLVLSQLQGMVLWTPFANRFVTTVNVYTVVLLVAGVAITTFRTNRRMACVTPVGTPRSTGPTRPVVL
jgi:hypothetical protein